MKIYMLTLILGFTSSMAIGQEPDISHKKITWNCVILKDKVSGNKVTNNSKFITQKNSISWIQNEFIQDFKITGRQWKWHNGRGSIIYKVKYYGVRGKVKIKRHALGTIITISLDKGAEIYALEVSNYSY